MSAFNEIYVYQEQTHDLFNSLTIQEKMFVYFIFRASIPFNQIARKQLHRYNVEIIELFEKLYQNKDCIEENLFSDIKTYLVYLWTNHGIYFLRSHSDNKFTPSKLGLKYLNENNLKELMKTLQLDIQHFEHLFPYIFDETLDLNLVVDGSIEESGGNLYAPEFTKKHYDMITSQQKEHVNTYFDLNEHNEPVMIPYSTTGHFSQELSVSVYWLKLALKHISKYPETFDHHLIKSLDLLIQFFETGDEEIFRLHTIEWLQSNSRLDYTIGFHETYNDPLQARGEAAAEITIKTVNMEEINPILLEIEQRMPIPDDYKKKSGENKTVMNVSMNKILYSSGHYGPMVIVAAYCLPNYNDIRSKFGSKQILYKLPPSLGETLNSELVNKFRTQTRKEFINNYDPNAEIYDDLWDVQVLLHETGHATGRLATHTFKEGENLIIGGKTYNVGDTVQVTDENLSEFLPTDQSSLEELRAEINALYSSIVEMDVLDKYGQYKDWVKKIGQSELKKQCIIEMCQHAFRRYLTQSDSMEDIKGAHARANVVLTNYLLEGGGIAIHEEVVNVEDKDYHLLEVQVIDFYKTYNRIVELVKLVQEIKSTGDTIGCKNLFDTFTKYPISLEQARKYRGYMKEVQEKLVGNLKARSRIYPNYQPVLDENGELLDVKLGPNVDIFEQNFAYNQLMLSTSY